MSNRLVQAIENYETMTRLESHGRLSEQEIQLRVARYGVRAAEEAALLDSTRRMLSKHGIPKVQVVMYHAYSRQVAKLRRQGSSMVRMQEVLRSYLMRWVARGLDEATLKDIAATLFNLPCPGGSD